MKPADHQVSISLTAWQWIEFLGYLTGVGMGDEVEAWRWIYNQLRTEMEAGHDDDERA